MITKVSHVTFFVLDQEKAYDFYVNKLGFKVNTDAKMENGFRYQNRLFFFFDLEREILLCHIAETDDDDRRQHLGDCRIDMELLHEELDEEDVQADANHHQDKIAKQLYPAMQRTARERNMPVENETRGKANAEGDKNGSDIRRKGPIKQMHILLMQDEVEAEPVHHDIQQCARPSTGRITEGLQRHQAGERRIEEINKSDDAIFHSGQRYLQNIENRPTCLTFAAN